jgi:hypothetical protein
MQQEVQRHTTRCLYQCAGHICCQQQHHPPLAQHAPALQLSCSGSPPWSPKSSS